MDGAPWNLPATRGRALIKPSCNIVQEKEHACGNLILHFRNIIPVRWKYISSGDGIRVPRIDVGVLIERSRNDKLKDWCDTSIRGYLVTSVMWRTATFISANAAPIFLHVTYKTETWIESCLTFAGFRKWLSCLAVNFFRAHPFTLW